MPVERTDLAKAQAEMPEEGDSDEEEEEDRERRQPSRADQEEEERERALPKEANRLERQSQKQQPRRAPNPPLHHRRPIVHQPSSPSAAVSARGGEAGAGGGLTLTYLVKSQVPVLVKTGEILREQLKAIQKELGELDERAEEAAEFRKRIKDAKMPDKVMKECEKQLKRLEKMHPDTAESATVRTYLEWMVDLPWSKRSKDNLDIKAAAKVLKHVEAKGGTGKFLRKE